MSATDENAPVPFLGSHRDRGERIKAILHARGGAEGAELVAVMGHFMSVALSAKPTFERNAKLEAENAQLRKQIEEADRAAKQESARTRTEIDRLTHELAEARKAKAKG